MASQPVTEDDLRRICLDAASRGERVGYIINDYLYLNFLHEQQLADRAASHRSDEDPDEWWTEAGAPRAVGRHRAAG